MEPVNKGRLFGEIVTDDLSYLGLLKSSYSSSFVVIFLHKFGPGIDTMGSINFALLTFHSVIRL